MIDISVLKRGGFNQFSTKSKAAQRQDEATLRQEEGKFCFDSVSIERMGETNAKDTFRNSTTNRSMKTTARESQ